MVLRLRREETVVGRYGKLIHGEVSRHPSYPVPYVVHQRDVVRQDKDLAPGPHLAVDGRRCQHLGLPGAGNALDAHHPPGIALRKLTLPVSQADFVVSLVTTVPLAAQEADNLIAGFISKAPPVVLHVEESPQVLRGEIVRSHRDDSGDDILRFLVILLGCWVEGGFNLYPVPPRKPDCGPYDVPGARIRDCLLEDLGRMLLDDAIPVTESPGEG